MVNAEVLAPMCRVQLLSNGMQPHLVESASFSEIAAMYMDDGKIRFPAAFSLEQVEEQFSAVLEFFSRHGIEREEIGVASCGGELCGSAPGHNQLCGQRVAVQG